MRLFPRRHREPDLLPAQAYPKHVKGERRRRLDATLRELVPLIPTEPGIYKDVQGDLWKLNNDGTWTDRRGETRGVDWNPILALSGPWSRATADSGSDDQSANRTPNSDDT